MEARDSGMPGKVIHDKSLRALTAALVLVVTLPIGAAGGQQRPIVLDPTYDHDRWGTQPVDAERRFRAFTSSFDTADDNNGDGEPDIWGVPEWVAHEVKSFGGECLPTGPRPSRWSTDAELNLARVAPTHDTYVMPRAFRSLHPNWFERGHLAMKFLAERLGEDAAWNTHTIVNAVPQRARFNQGIWADLEDLTGAWANRFGAVWVVTGPVFVDRHSIAWIGDPERGQVRSAVPEALFKIIIRESNDPDQPNVLAFLYPQVGPGYTRSPYDHRRFLTTVAEIEELTGLMFLNALSPAAREDVVARSATELWPAEESDFVQACQSN